MPMTATKAYYDHQRERLRHARWASAHNAAVIGSANAAFMMDHVAHGGGITAPVPHLAELVPAAVMIGPDEPDITLHVRGLGFTPGCTIVFNGGDETTVFVDTHELTTIVKPSLGSIAVTVPVLVRSEDGETSNALDFSFTAPELMEVAGPDKRPRPKER